MKPTIDTIQPPRETWTMPPDSTDSSGFDYRSNIKPFLFIITIVFIVVGFAFIVYRDSPVQYKLSICTGSDCKTTLVNSLRVDERKITIYIDRHSNRIKQVLVLDINQNAIVTPIYR